MKKSMLWIGATTLASACASLADYPSEWHDTTDSIHVYGSMPAKTIVVPAGKDLTLLDAFFGLGDERGDSTRIVVFRREDASVMRIDVDVREMLRTGKTTHNILLRPGDVLHVTG